MDSPLGITGYQPLDVLGEGTEGVVQRALQTGLGREVALKIFRTRAFAAGSELELRFRREVEISTQLSHSGIARVFDAGVQDGTLYYAMELIRGKDLQRLRDRQGPLPVAQVTEVLRQLIDALAYMHERGLVHRDIKPGNVMIEEGTGRAVLLDMGLVRMTEATMITAPGQLIGSPRYMAPEQLRGSPCTAASDLWSLGVTAYTLLAPRPAFDGRDLGELSRAILRASPPPLTAVRADVPEWLAERIMRLIVSEPAARTVLPEHAPRPAAAPRSLPPSPAPEPRAAPRSRAPTYVILAALSLIGLGLHQTVQRWSQPRPEDASIGSTAILPEASGRDAGSTQPAGELAALRFLNTLSSSHWSGGAGETLWRRLGSRLLGPDGRITGKLRRLAIEDPAMGGRIDAEIAAVVAPALGTFAHVKPHLASLLSSTGDETSPALRQRLMDAVWKLDQVDAVAEYLSRPAPFCVQRALSPAVEYTCRPDSPGARQDLHVGRQIYPFATEPPGHLIFVDRDDPQRGGDLMSSIGETAIDLHDNTHLGTVKSASMELGEIQPGSGGFRLSLLLTSFPEQSAVRLTGRAGELDLRLRRPVRPYTFIDLDRPVWVAITVRGGLARCTGRLTLRHDRAFEDSGRIFVWLKEAWIEAIR